jgi:hypothetical protein
MQRRRFLALGLLALAGCEPLSRRVLLLAGSGGSFTIPGPVPPSVVTLTSAATGGAMSPWNIPCATVIDGKAWISYVDGSGNLEIVTYDGSTVGGPYTLHAALQEDAHNGPAFARRASDGKVVAIYCRHNDTPINVRVSTNPDDPSAWGSATDLDSQLGGTRYTDVQLYELSDGTLFLFYRDEPSAGTDSRWCYSTSTDGGSTWAAQTILYRINSTRSYVISWKAPGSDLIHFVATNGASTGFTKLGHFRMDGLTLARTKSDGTSIAASLPLGFADLTEVYSSAGSGVFFTNIALASGNPVVGVREDSTMDVIYARWSGSAWASTVVANGGTGYEYSGTGTGFAAWGHAVDDGDPDVMWVLRDTGGFPELWRYRTEDGGATFSGLQVSSGTGQDQQTVIPVRNPQSWLRAVWQVGTWDNYNANIAVGIKGVTA